MNSLLTAIRVSVVLTLLCGIAYPLAVTGVAQLLFPAEAEGSLIRTASGVQGSELLAQRVTSAGLFQPRASTANYDPTASSGSNRASAQQPMRRRSRPRQRRGKKKILP